MNQEQEQKIIGLLEVAFGKQLWRLMKDNRLTELMANPDGRIWLDMIGKGLLETGVVLDESARQRIISIVAGAEGRICNSDNPTLAAILPYFGARFQGFVSPVVPGASFSIRLKSKRVFSLDEYVTDNILSLVHCHRIKRVVAERGNILIVGGTGSGKTTLANAVLNEISQTGHRIVTIEDAAELQCTAPNTLQLFVNDDVGFDWRSAVKVSLRARPDRIVVGEVRDSSALDLLKAWNTGHNGGCATIHANGAIQGLSRMESLIEEAVPNAPKELIGEAIDLIVHITRSNKGRVIDQMVAVNGFDKVSGEYLTTKF